MEDMVNAIKEIPGRTATRVFEHSVATLKQNNFDNLAATLSSRKDEIGVPVTSMWR